MQSRLDGHEAGAVVAFQISCTHLMFFFSSSSTLAPGSWAARIINLISSQNQHIQSTHSCKQLCRGNGRLLQQNERWFYLRDSQGGCRFSRPPIQPPARQTDIKQTHTRAIITHLSRQTIDGWLDVRICWMFNPNRSDSEFMYPVINVCFWPVSCKCPSS